MSSLTVYTPKITILDQAINMIDGLYSLNDMHKASGRADKHRPTFFLRNQETKDLIAELEGEVSDVRKCTSLESQVIRVVKGNFTDGIKQGTYVCKELVYRYAMWISPKFALLVIRTFDKLVTGELKVATNNSELTAEQTLPLREAVSKLVTKLGILYPEGYKLVHQRFSVGHIKKLKPEQIPQAVEYIHNLQMQAYSGSLNIDAAIDNEMWRYVGLLKYMQLSEALREAQEASNKLHRAITGAQRHGGLVYDAFSEQQKIMSLGEHGTNEAYEKAKDFVARQDALLDRCRTL